LAIAAENAATLLIEYFSRVIDDATLLQRFDVFAPWWVIIPWDHRKSISSKRE
jgi:hypothetical protein